MEQNEILKKWLGEIFDDRNAEMKMSSERHGRRRQKFIEHMLNVKEGMDDLNSKMNAAREEDTSAMPLMLNLFQSGFVPELEAAVRLVFEIPKESPETEAQLAEIEGFCKAFRALSPPIRRNVVRQTHRYAHWSWWLSRVLHWDEERIMDFVEEIHLRGEALGIESGWFDHYSLLDHIIGPFIPEEMNAKLSPLDHEFFGKDLSFAMRGFSGRSIWQEDFPWDEVPRVIQFVTESWREHDYQRPPRGELLRKYWSDPQTPPRGGTTVN